jgi:MFS family permease
MRKKGNIIPRRFYYGYWIVIALFLCQIIVHGSVIYSFSLFVLPLDNAFGWSRTAIMTGYLLCCLVAGLVAPLIGWIISRTGIKWIFVAGAILIGGGFLLLSTTQAIWQFYLYYAVVGIGYTTAGVVPATMLASTWFTRRRGFAIGLVGIGVGLGGLVMPWIMSNLVMPNFSWQTSYSLIGLITMVVIIPLACFVLRSKPEDIVEENSDSVNTSHTHKKVIEEGIESHRAFKLTAFWFLGISIFFMSLGMNNSLQSQIPHLQEIGFSAVVAAMAMQATGIGSALGKIAFGWLCDYIKPKLVFIMGCGFNIIAGLVLATVSSSNPVPVIWICGFVNGLGVGIWLPAISMNTSYIFGLVSYGVIFGIYQLVFQVAGALAPLIGGYVFDLTRSYVNSFWLGMVFQVIAIIFLLMLHRPGKTGTKVS